MKSIKINAFEQEYEIYFSKNRYANNNNIAILCVIEDKEYGGYEPWCTLTVNLDRLSTDNFAFMDVNSPTVPQILSELEKLDLIKNTGVTRQSGFVTYPLYDMSDKFINEWCIDKLI